MHAGTCLRAARLEPNFCLLTNNETAGNRSEKVSPFLLALQRSENIAAALDLHSTKQAGRDPGRDEDADRFSSEANSKRAFERLANIAALSAANGTCRAADLEEILSRMRERT